MKCWNIRKVLWGLVGCVCEVQHEMELSEQVWSVSLIWIFICLCDNTMNTEPVAHSPNPAPLVRCARINLIVLLKKSIYLFTFLKDENLNTLRTLQQQQQPCNREASLLTAAERGWRWARPPDNEEDTERQWKGKGETRRKEALSYIDGTGKVRMETIWRRQIKKSYQSGRSEIRTMPRAIRVPPKIAASLWCSGSSRNAAASYDRESYQNITSIKGEVISWRNSSFI